MSTKEINNKVTIIINGNGMGSGPSELTNTLVKNYIALLNDEKRVPVYLCLYADGVYLACEGSHIIEEMKALEKAGTKIVICKTCLTFNGLLDKVAVGSIGTMVDIMDIQHNSTKVITL